MFFKVLLLIIYAVFILNVSWLQRISAWDFILLVLLFFKNSSIKSAFIFKPNFLKVEHRNSCICAIAPYHNTVYFMLREILLALRAE